ncbi:hypothetical protein WN55_04846 [Dufourea novaeangliae]|uniref:Uncharacterized protein n=1 Tax=Dufourea novaeangliae TaxID=178035 RepID=A0A154NZC2_DUFNO|nr:hypothetical protein WN55_04846 [Dufourea novaeangliae]
MRIKEDQSIRAIIEEEWKSMFQEDRKELRRRAKEAILKLQMENRKSFNKKKTKAKRYEAGELVAIRRTQFGPGLKLYPKYLGPYEVVRALRNDRYITSTAAELHETVE